MDAFKVIDLRGAPPAFQNQLDRMTEAPTFKVRIVNVRWKSAAAQYGAILRPDFLTQRFMVTR